MMKSFFKKLAFVMALAMVVTLAAPAGTAALAADFFIAEQNVKNVAITEYKLAVGDEQDFWYRGATEYAKYNFGWTSSKPEVADVDKNGIVKGIKDGEAVITCTGTSKADGKTVGYTASMVVTVGEGEAKPVVTPSATGYKVEQTTVSSINVIFDGTHKYTKSDVRLQYVVDGGWVVEWPLEDVEPIEGGFKVTPYVEFADGGKYILYVGAEDKGYEFTTSYGTVTHLELYYTIGENETKYDGGEVKINVDELDENEDVVFGAKFFSGTVDVTALYSAYEEYVEYDVITNDEDSIEVMGGSMQFLEAGVGVAVTASVSIETEEDDYEVNSKSAMGLVSRALPKYGIATMTGWAIVKDDADPAYADIDWAKHTIRANDDAEDTATSYYHLVVKFADTYGNTIITDEKYEDPENKIYAMNNMDCKFSETGYTFKFTSANPSKLLVGLDDASLTTYTAADVAIIVGLYTTNPDSEEAKDDEGFIKNATAFVVSVSEERKISKVEVNAPTVTLPNTVNNNETDFLQKTVEIVIKDQYGDLWTEDVKLSVTPSVNNISLSATDIWYDGAPNLVQAKDENGNLKWAVDENGAPVYEKDEEGNNKLDDAGNPIPVPVMEEVAAAKKATVTINGRTMYTALSAANKNSVSFTLKAANNVTTSLNVKTQVVTNTVGNISVKTRKLDAKSVEVATDAYTKLPISTSITLTEYHKSGIAVGMVEGITPFPSTEAGVAAIVKDTASVGARYIAVYKPDGKQVGMATSTTVDGKVVPTSLGVYLNENDVYCVCVAIDEGNDGYMNYLPTGTFNVTIKKISKFLSDNSAKFDDEFKTSFVVSDNSPRLEFVGLEANETEYTDLVSIVNELVKVKLTGATENWTFDGDNIIKVYGRYNEDSGYVIITAVEFRIPLDGDDDPKAYTGKVEINEAIKLTTGTLTTEFIDGVYTK